MYPLVCVHGKPKDYLTLRHAVVSLGMHEIVDVVHTYRSAGHLYEYHVIIKISGLQSEGRYFKIYVNLAALVW